MTGLATPPARPACPNARRNRSWRIAQAAQQFEAILLRMLASARNTDFGGNDLLGKATTPEMRGARFAEVTAQSGQLGFAAAIEHQLARFLPEGDD